MEFEQIYQMYFRDVYLYLRSLSAREDIAEEIAQEAFVKALKAIDDVYYGEFDDEFMREIPVISGEWDMIWSR